MKDEYYIVGLGASAGGIKILYDFFSNMPFTEKLAFVVITHLKRDFKSSLPYLLSKHSKYEVKTMVDEEEIKPGKVYVLPENKKVRIKEGILHLRERPDSEIVNFTIDDFFYSLAMDKKNLAIGVVLSGLGNDGTKGAVAIEENGGLVIVQDPNTAQFDSMPINAIDHDHPDYILSPSKMPQFILKHIESRAEEIRFLTKNQLL